MLYRLRPVNLLRRDVRVAVTIFRARSTNSTTEVTAKSPKFIGDLNTDEPIHSKRLYRYLRLENYTQAEFQKVFQTLENNQDGDETNDGPGGSSGAITEAHFQKFIEKRIIEMEKENDQMINNYDDKSVISMRQQFSQVEAKRCWKFFEKGRSSDVELTQEELANTLKDTASSVDVKRILPLTLSMILVGSSVGVVTPAMPFVVQDLGLTAGEYGLVVSAFALAKMTGNIPSAVLVERHGRKVSHNCLKIKSESKAHLLSLSKALSCILDGCNCYRSRRYWSINLL